MSHTEQELPAIRIDRDTNEGGKVVLNVVVSGISLRCTDEVIDNTNDNPFRPIEKSGPEGAFRVSLLDYSNLAPTD